ncbi:MAG: transcriptional repressor [Muribaculaceae bacterium]|nr:transcriptional repressor [Muribaculaceae bacterium]
MKTTDDKPSRAEAAERTFAEFLSASGLRKTPERFEILSRVLEIKGHFGVDYLHGLMEESGYHVSRATVYNTLDLLLDCGLIRRHIFETHQARYEVAGTSHFHLVCTRCGRISEADDRQIARALDSIRHGDFRPAYFSATVYGLCGDCMAGEKSPQHKSRKKTRLT